MPLKEKLLFHLAWTIGWITASAAGIILKLAIGLFATWFYELSWAATSLIISNTLLHFFYIKKAAWWRKNWKVAMQVAIGILLAIGLAYLIW